MPQLPTDHQQLWLNFIRGVQTKNKTLGSLLQAARLVTIEVNQLQLEVYYQFHYDQLQQPSVQNLLSTIISEIFGSDLALSVQLATSNEVKDKELLDAAETYLV